MKFVAIAGLMFVTYVGALPFQLAAILATLCIIISMLSAASRKRSHQNMAQAQTWLREHVARR